MNAQHIGIVACTAEGAALCYRTLCVEGARLMGGYAHPEVSVHTHSLADYVDCLSRDDWRGVGELMLSSAHKLASLGADFLICPAATIHRALSHIESRLPRPWLHIAAVSAAHAKERGFQCIGITGTRQMVESDIFPTKLTEVGLRYVRPDAAERAAIDRIIFEELVRGVFTVESLQYLQKVITGLKDQGCDAVVLGCTELPLLLNDANSPLPTIDSTRTLARAALQRAVQPRPPYAGLRAAI